MSNTIIAWWNGVRWSVLSLSLFVIYVYSNNERNASSLESPWTRLGKAGESPQNMLRSRIANVIKPIPEGNEDKTKCRTVESRPKSAPIDPS